MSGQIRRFHQSGFSLLEVLVTMVIIAVGLMGFAAMMVNSMKNNRLAMQRSMATFYAYDIIDCMRVNRQGMTAGSYTRDFISAIPTAGASVAATDLYFWLTSLSAALPSGAADIKISGSETVTVQIRWSESLNASDNTVHTWKTVSTL